MADLSKEEMARKALELAEESFVAGNLFGAKTWMLSAVRLAPDLPGNAQATAAYNVHAAARRSPPDWYAVLDLPDPSGGPHAVTHDAIKRQHRKLCQLVHPDKNPSKAAGSAFKFMQDAYDALSARHPPSAAAARPASPQAPPSWPARRPPDPPQEKPQPKPRPQVVQMQRKSAPAPKPSKPPAPKQMSPPPPPPPPERPSGPVAGSCPACGAFTTSSGKSNFRCVSCKWSPMDYRGYDDDDYDDDYEYYH